MKPIIWVLILCAACSTARAERYLFSFHGAIVESQGKTAYSSEYGAYKYDDIIAAFRKEGFAVMTEYRQPNTDVQLYARKIVRQIDSLLKQGIKATDISVIGASKGAMIAMYVSSYLKNKEVNFIFMSACNEYNAEANPEIVFCGNVLSVYEESDDIGKTCAPFTARKNSNTPHYKEVVLHTGLKHGYFYQPRPEWLVPAMRWAHGVYE